MLVSTFAQKNLYPQNSEFNKTSTPCKNSALNNFNLNNYSSNNLIDFNYGRSLIKNKNLSFGSEIPVSLTQRIATALTSFSKDDLLLVCKNAKKAKRLLIDSMNVDRREALFPYAIKKVLIIDDGNFDGYIALKYDNLNLLEAINLDGDLIRGIGNGDSGLHIAGKFEKLTGISNEDTIVTNTSSFKVSYNQPDIIDIKDCGIKQFDFSEILKQEIKRLNIKNLNSMFEKNLAQNGHIKKITFEDIAGQDETIEEIFRTIIYPTENPNFFGSIGMDGVRSVLFLGPPGNGKSLSAQALANRLGIPFYNMNGQLLQGGLVGESAHKTVNYYDEARRNQPCIIFFDEAEGVLAKRRGLDPHADKQTSLHLDEISQLEREGAKVILIAATNKPHEIDEAALRFGRFGTKILFKNPGTAKACQDVFNVHTRLLNIEDFISDEFAERLLKANVSCADIAGVIEEGKINAIERLGLYEQMEKKTFIDSPDIKLIMKGEDLDKSLHNLTEKRKILAEYNEKT